jgi:hypothetical protein
MDAEDALDKATESVISDLPEKKRKAYERKNWGDRPEHLRKSISQMSIEEKKEFRLWQAGELKTEEIQDKPVYEENEIYAVGYVILPMLASRLPNPVPPSEIELRGFAKAFTPLVNKYVTAFAYKEEVNAAIFALAFFIPRAKAQMPILSENEIGYQG